MNSQNDEEKYILGLVKDISKGTFLDIGSYDGHTFSNTAALVERGWSGVLVEPACEPFKALMDYVKGRRHLYAVNAAVAPEGTGLVEFSQTRDLISTMDAAHREKWEGTIASSNPYRRSFVPTVSYRRLLACQLLPFDKFDVVNLDIEGCNWGVFSEIMQLPHTVKRLVCVEFDDKRDQMVELAKSKGFSLAHQTNENLILVRR